MDLADKTWHTVTNKCAILIKMIVVSDQTIDAHTLVLSVLVEVFDLTKYAFVRASDILAVLVKMLDDSKRIHNTLDSFQR
jgi:hypothetical protein